MPKQQVLPKKKDGQMSFFGCERGLFAKILIVEKTMPFVLFQNVGELEYQLLTGNLSSSNVIISIYLVNNRRKKLL